MNLDPLGFNQNTDPSGLNNYPALLAVETHESAPPNENWWDKTKRIIGEVGHARNASIAAAAKPLGEVGASLITGTAALGPAIGSMLIPSQESIDNLINGNWNTFINPRVELQSRLNRARQAAGLFTYEPTNPEAKTILKPVNDVVGFLPKYGGEARDYYNSLGDQAEKNGDLKTAEAWRYLATTTDFSAEALNLYALSKAGKTGGILKEKVTPPEINLGDLSGDGKPYSITQLPAPQEPIVNRVGNPYRTSADAQSIMESKGLADTHEVIPYESGFALQRKGAQSLLQDLLDPLKLYKEPVPTQETPAPVKAQSVPSMPGIDTKEPWQMTPDELSLSHRTIIEKALSENKPVPAEVLKDYPDLAIEHGKSIIDQMIKDHTDKPAAMYRDDVGTIEFPWGKEGNPKNSYYGGFGVSHIIAKHGEPVANKVVEVIAEGDICKESGPPNGTRIDVKYDGHTAILSLYKNRNRETWLLTGWKDDIPTGEPEGEYGPAGSTHNGPMRFRPDVGAVNKNLITPAKDFVNSKHYKDDYKKTPGVPEESNNLQDYAHQTSGSRSDVGAGVDNNLTPANDSVNSKHNKEGKNSQQGRIVPRGRINGQY